MSELEKFGKFLENGEYLESELEKMKDANKHLQISLDKIEAAEMHHHAMLWKIHCLVRSVQPNSGHMYLSIINDVFKLTDSYFKDKE